MTTVDLVRAAKTPKEAMLGLAGAIDDIYARLEKLEEGGGWDSWGEDVEDDAWEEEPSAGEGYIQDHGPQMGAVTVEYTDAGPVFTFPPIDEERQALRRMVERQQLKLAAAIGDDAPEPEGGWTEAYVRGGPWWLYQHRRDLVMTYDMNVRRRLVSDVELDSPKLAYEMSLDILKEPCGEPDLEGGSGALAVANVGTKGMRRG